MAMDMAIAMDIEDAQLYKAFMLESADYKKAFLIGKLISIYKLDEFMKQYLLNVKNFIQHCFITIEDQLTQEQYNIFVKFMIIKACDFYINITEIVKLLEILNMNQVIHIINITNRAVKAKEFQKLLPYKLFPGEQTSFNTSELYNDGEFSGTLVKNNGGEIIDNMSSYDTRQKMKLLVFGIYKLMRKQPSYLQMKVWLWIIMSGDDLDIMLPTFLKTLTLEQLTFVSE